MGAMVEAAVGMDVERHRKKKITQFSSRHGTHLAGENSLSRILVTDN